MTIQDIISELNISDMVQDTVTPRVTSLLGTLVCVLYYFMQSYFNRERTATGATMISLRIFQHLEGGANQLLAKVHSGSFHKFKAVLVHDNTYSFLLKHSESRAQWMQVGRELIKLLDNKKTISWKLQ